MKMQVWWCPIVSGLEFFQAIVLITTKQQVFGETIISKNGLLANWVL